MNIRDTILIRPSTSDGRTLEPDLQRWEDEGGSPVQGRMPCPGLRLRGGDRLLVERVHEISSEAGEVRFLVELRMLYGE